MSFYITHISPKKAFFVLVKKERKVNTLEILYNHVVVDEH